MPKVMIALAFLVSIFGFTDTASAQLPYWWTRNSSSTIASFSGAIRGELWNPNYDVEWDPSPFVEDYVTNGVTQYGTDSALVSGGVGTATVGLSYMTISNTAQIAWNAPNQAVFNFAGITSGNVLSQMHIGGEWCEGYYNNFVVANSVHTLNCSVSTPPCVQLNFNLAYIFAQTGVGWLRPAAVSPYSYSLCVHGFRGDVTVSVDDGYGHATYIDDNNEYVEEWFFPDTYGLVLTDCSVICNDVITTTFFLNEALDTASWGLSDNGFFPENFVGGSSTTSSFSLMAF